MKQQIEWWKPKYGFFGEHYLKGDNSLEGYLMSQKQTLTERTTAEVNGIIRLLQLITGDRILDIPCGYGRHSIELAKQGFDIVGSDINPIHLAKARDDARIANIEITFQEENMLTATYSHEFEAVINMFYSFGFFEAEEDNLRTLKNFYAALKPKGKFLFHTDVNLPRVLAGNYKTSEQRILMTGGNLRITDNYDPQTRRMNGSWIITDNKGVTQKDYSVRIYSREEFEELCFQAGFTACRSYGDWNGSAYSEQSEDMIIVATK